jgi:hypothetical protein
MAVVTVGSVGVSGGSDRDAAGAVLVAAAVVTVTTDAVMIVIIIVITDVVLVVRQPVHVVHPTANGRDVARSRHRRRRCCRRDT